MRAGVLLLGAGRREDDDDEFGRIWKRNCNDAPYFLRSRSGLRRD